MLLLDSAKVWEVGEEEKEEAGGWRKIREAGEPRKNSVGKEEAGGRKKDVAAAQGLAEQKGANFLKNRIFPRQSGKMGNRVCKSLPRLVFSFTAKKFEVQFSQALYKVDQKKGVYFSKSGF